MCDRNIILYSIPFFILYSIVSVTLFFLFFSFFLSLSFFLPSTHKEWKKRRGRKCLLVTLQSSKRCRRKQKQSEERGRRAKRERKREGERKRRRKRKKMLKLMMLNWIKLSDLYHSLNTFLSIFSSFPLSLSFFLSLSLILFLSPSFSLSLYRHHYIDDEADFCP